MKKANTLVWVGLRHAVPFFLTMPPSLIIENNVFDILMKKSKDYYTKLISKKNSVIISKKTSSNNSLVLKRDFSLNEDQLRKMFLLPHMVCSEAYVKAFQYKVLNFIIYIPILNNYPAKSRGISSDTKPTGRRPSRLKSDDIPRD